MKKLFFIVCSFLMATTSIAQNVGEEIGFDVELIDPTETNEPVGRGPILIPSVIYESHILYFVTPCDGCTLRLLDENGVVVYSTVIPTGTISLVLPSSLLGEYEIQIIQGNICFYGYITL